MYEKLRQRYYNILLPALFLPHLLLLFLNDFATFPKEIKLVTYSMFENRKPMPLCSRNFQNVKLRLDFVEI